MKFLTLVLSTIGLSGCTLAASGPYEQCGGNNWAGSHACSDGWSCICQTEWYSQCLPSNQPPPSGFNQASCKTSGSSSQPPTASSSPTPSTGSNNGNPSPGGSESQSCSTVTGDKSGLASTTHYYDGNKGACGCGSDSGAFPWQLGSGSLWTAAASPQLFDNDGSSEWCGSGCGTCYELTNLGKIAANGQGDCTGAGQTITVMVTNLCPAAGNEVWCSTPTNSYGYGAHFDINAQGSPADGWNNPVVSYKKVACPSSLASDYQQCQCAGTSRVRRGLFQSDWANAIHQ